MIRPNIDRRMATARLAAAPRGNKGTTILEAGVVPHALSLERDGAAESVWDRVRGTSRLGAARTESLQMSRMARMAWGSY